MAGGYSQEERLRRRSATRPDDVDDQQRALSDFGRGLVDSVSTEGRDGPVPAVAIQTLQRRYGNRAVQRLLERDGGRRDHHVRPQVVQRTPAAPAGASGPVVRDLSKLTVDPVPDFLAGSLTAARVVNPHVIDPAVKHLTWMLHDPSDQMIGGYSTLPSSPTAKTLPFTLDPGDFGATATIGKYILRCVGLNASHQPVVYADRDFNVVKADLTTGTPLATTYGELTFTKYSKTDASPPGTGSWSIDVELKFLPKTTVASNDIAFMQALESVDSTGKSQHRFTSADQDARQTPLAWSIDRVAGAPSPFYISGRDPSGAVVDEPGWGKKGKGGPSPKAATLIDQPSWNKETYDKFESCVIARSGPNKGQVYGCATWGYTADRNGKVTLMPRTFHEAPSEEFVEARAAWNAWRATVAAADRPDEAPALKSP